MTRRRAALSLVCVALPLAHQGCADELPPLGHIVLYVDTDAPLPQAPGVVSDPDAPPALFDRVRIDLYRKGETSPCEGCSREFDLNEDLVRAGASITIPAGGEVGSAPRARVRLFRGTPLGADPSPGSTVEAIFQLPELPVEGSAEVTAFLPTDALGVPLGSLEAPMPPSMGWSGAGHAGTWPPARRVPCTGEGREGEVCVPGGAFWMGDRTLVDFGLEVDTNVERLVVLAPFWIDSREVTVVEFRNAGGAGAQAWSGQYGGPLTAVADYCTFTASPHAFHDLLPVNCLPPVAAAAYCAKRGSALPTEAQWEYVAGALASSAHPWGADDPTCDDAVWGRMPPVPSDPALAGACSVSGEPALPAPLIGADGATRPGRDRVELEGGTVFDLAGNVSEWARDIANEPGEACWPIDGPQVFYDPICASLGEEGPLHIFRGGNFLMASYWTRASARRSGFGSPETGFRCARPDAGPVGPVDCLGFAEDFDASCAVCLESSCCEVLVEGSGETTQSLLDCAIERCEAQCFVTVAPECRAPPPPAAVGACVTLSASIACNPVTNEGCDTAANEACDQAKDGFACFDPPNDAGLCDACDAVEGPFCAPGSTCFLDVGCAKYCCEDEDCTPGNCYRGEEGRPLFAAVPGLGVCVE